MGTMLQSTLSLVLTIRPEDRQQQLADTPQLSASRCSHTGRSPMQRKDSLAEKLAFSDKAKRMRTDGLRLKRLSLTATEVGAAVFPLRQCRRARSMAGPVGH